MPINPFFDWLKDSGTQAVLVLLGTVAALVAAIGTIHYGKKSLTKRDLATIERHTGESTHHLKRQTEKDALAVRVDRVSLSVWGHDPLNENLRIDIMCYDPDALPTRLGLYNENGALFGTTPLVRDPDGNYWTEVDPATALAWFQGGTSVQNGHRLNLRVYIMIDGNEAFREFSVSMRQMEIERNGQRYMGYRIEGSI